MPLFQLNTPNLDPREEKDKPIPTAQDIPKDELDLFFRSIWSFIPEGKTWDDLSKKEQQEIMDKYRFSEFRPGMYQGITGLGTKMI